ncbi:MAG: hypothetical protein KDC72_06295 [Bacteroidetes bacterium]|nr:hypothetical protein [Bacteroidota bacterium]
MAINNYYFEIDNFKVEELTPIEDTLYTHHCDSILDNWRTRIMPDIDTTNHSEFAYDQAGTLIWQEATEDLRIQHREVLNSEMAVYVKHLGVAAKQQTVEAGTPHILSLDIKSKSANTSNAMILIADKDSYDTYGAAMLMGGSPALIYVWQEMPDTGLQQFIFTPLHDEIVIAILHGTSSVGGHLDFDDVKIIKHTPIVHEIFDTSIVPWRSTLTEPQADTTYFVGSLECDSTNQKLKVHLAMFDNPYMDANTMTALALKPIDVQPNSRYNLKIDIENGNFGANDSLFYTIAILNGNEYAEQGFTATVLTEQATENIIEPSDLFNTHTLSFTTDAATNNIVLQVFMMLNDSTQNNLYFTINNVTLEEINGGEIYTINPHSSLNKYRFGFNGQERETELSTSHTSAEFWMYDGRIGKRWNIDPVTYPWQSSYATFNNSPIRTSDHLGLYGTEAEANDNRQKALDAGLSDVSDVGQFDDGTFGFSASTFQKIGEIDYQANITTFKDATDFSQYTKPQGNSNGTGITLDAFLAGLTKTETNSISTWKVREFWYKPNVNRLEAYRNAPLEVRWDKSNLRNTLTRQAWEKLTPEFRAFSENAKNFKVDPNASFWKVNSKAMWQARGAGVLGAIGLGYTAYSTYNKSISSGNFRQTMIKETFNLSSAFFTGSFVGTGTAILATAICPQCTIAIGASYLIGNIGGGMWGYNKGKSISNSILPDEE